jgi:hypothetical protein
MHCRRSFRQPLCAPAVFAAWLFSAPLAALAQVRAPELSVEAPHAVARPDYSAGRRLALAEPTEWLVSDSAANDTQIVQLAPEGQVWIAPPGGGAISELPAGDGGGYWIEPHAQGRMYFDDGSPQPWTWQVLPDGIIYHSYMAGVHEPRMSVVMFEERDGRQLWDATIGGRVGVLRFGDCDPIRPQGWQLDFEGAAIMRFTFDRARDFETADYRAGVPITYGSGDWQYKFAYYHLSSHMGDEFALRNPGALADRINYVRDALVLGASYYPHPVMRLYSEAAYALKADGGADPWEFQFGTEFSRPGPTGRRGTPFLAVNAHLREEHDFGGDVTTQVGWLWRGRESQTMRLGFHYFNGKSSQYQTFDDSEEQLGFGVWYDF